jgi:hypothetical protein
MQHVVCSRGSMEQLTYETEQLNELGLYKINPVRLLCYHEENPPQDAHNHCLNSK